MEKIATKTALMLVANGVGDYITGLSSSVDNLDTELDQFESMFDYTTEDDVIDILVDIGILPSGSTTVNP